MKVAEASEPGLAGFFRDWIWIPSHWFLLALAIFSPMPPDAGKN
jgi:hypothetical protein